jgi:pyruvate dehydrogenase E2 component (dihydrolipoyllysine-residue acetyltransferase)
MEFRLPDVGEGIATAEILTWHVAEGDHVTEHQDLVEIQTDKAVAVIPCPATGVVVRLCGEEGETIDVGAVLAVIEVDGDGAPARRAATPHAAAAASSAPAAAPRSQLPLAAPSTRRLARELGVALEHVAGSGPHGRITREDVERAAAAAPTAAPVPEPAPPRAPAPEPGEVIPLRGVRRTIAHALTRAWLEVPRIIDFREVDATALVSARASLRRRALDRGDEALARALTPTPLIVRAAVLAARDNPYVNASIDLEGEQITLHRHYHVGIATAGPDGLTVPVVHDADRRSLAEIALEIVALAGAARERRLTPAQLAGPTFTVNNFGSLGTWMGTPIIRPPEVVNLGVGAIRDRVVAVDGAPVVRPTLVLSVAGDHRVLDGDTLSAFVDQVATLLEDPVLLFEDLR